MATDEGKRSDKVTPTQVSRKRKAVAGPPASSSPARMSVPHHAPPEQARRIHKFTGIPRMPYQSGAGIMASAANPTTQGVGSYHEIGVSGLTVRNGNVYDDYNIDLVALSDRMARFEEMRRSDTACATIEVLLNLMVSRASWHVKPQKDDATLRGSKIAARIEQNIMREMSKPWKDFVRLSLLGPLYGFSVFEHVWERKSDGIIGWRKLADRDRRTVNRWHFDDTGGIQGYECAGYTLGNDREYVRRDIPIEKLLIYTWREEAGNPEGIGVLRQAWKPYSYKSAFEEFAAMRIERQAIGIPVAKEPEDIDIKETERTEIAQQIARMLANEAMGMIVPFDWEFDMLWPGPADVPFEAHIERQHQYILQTMLAQFVGYSQGGDRGSFGLSEDASTLFLYAMASVADWICEGFNRYAIPRWMQYNFPDHRPHPELQHGPIGNRDIGEWGNLFRSIFDVNTLAPRRHISHALEEAGMPALDDQDWAEIVGLRQKRLSSRNPGQEVSREVAAEESEETGGSA